MTREEAKELLPIMQAYVEGKTIQYKYLGKWEDVVSEAYFETYPFTKYRIKSEPKYRPFNNQAECWNDMLKHQPFGWVRTIKLLFLIMKLLNGSSLPMVRHSG